MSYADMLRLFDAHTVTGRHYAMRTRTVANYSPDVIAGLIDAGDSLTSSLSSIFIHHFHGASIRVPVEATAFSLRRRHHVVEVLAAWEPDQDGAPHRAWADRVATGLAAYALPGGYANLLGADDHDQITHAYGPNAIRLRQLKKRFDPQDVFTAIPSRPSLSRTPDVPLSPCGGSLSHAPRRPSRHARMTATQFGRNEMQDVSRTRR